MFEVTRNAARLLAAYELEAKLRDSLSALLHSIVYGPDAAAVGDERIARLVEEILALGVWRPQPPTPEIEQ